VKKGKAKNIWGNEVEIDVPDGIIAHLMRECGGNVHDRNVVDVTCGSFEKETEGANPHSGAFHNSIDYAAKKAADLETDSWFLSAFRTRFEENIPHTRNNWICYDFREKSIVPTHYTIRMHEYGPGYSHLKSWLVKTSADREAGGRSPARRTTSGSTAHILPAHLLLRAAGCAASSGW
jgi:hypothetical protein